MSAARPIAVLLLACAPATAQWLHDPVPFPTGDAPRDHAAADLDGDGRNDLVVLCGSFSASPVFLTVMLGAPEGGFGSSFTTPLSQPLGGITDAIALGDITGDGVPDLVATDSFTQEVRVFPGDGAGGFGAPAHTSTHANSSVLALGDLDLDGWLDAGAGHNFPHGVSALHNAAGTLVAALPIPTLSPPIRLFIATFDADALPDVLFQAGFGPHAVVLLPGTGGGALGAPQTVYTTAGIDAVSADLDADGDLDLVQGRTPTGAVALDTVRNDGTGQFALGSTLVTGGVNASSVAAADFDLDGLPDALLSSFTDSTLRTARGAPGAGLELGPLMSMPSFPGYLLTAELSGDARPDVALTLGAVDALLVFTANEAQLRFGNPAASMAGNNAGRVTLGDLNGNGEVDAVVTGAGNDEIRRFLGNGAGGFGTKKDFPAGDSPVAIDLGDIDEDGDLDAICAASVADAIELLRGDGAGNFAAPIATPALDVANSVFVRDFDGDGHLDVLASGFFVAELQVFPGDGTGALLAPLVIPLPGAPMVGVGDLDGDFLPDVVIGDQAAGTVQAWLNDGAGALLPQAAVRTGSFPGSPLVSDLDDDGLADVAVVTGSIGGQPAASVAVLHGDGAGGLQPPIHLPSAHFLTFGATDLDGDGRPDLAGTQLAVYAVPTPAVAFHTLHVFQSGDGGVFKPSSVVTSDVGDDGMAFADLDGDGRRDVIAVSSGPNKLLSLLNQSQPHPWHDVGSALAGAHGPPALTGTGWAEAGTPGALELRGAAAQAATVLFVSPVSTPTPFKGGVLLPVPPALATPLVTDLHGAFTLGWTSWPALTTGSTYWLQAAIADAAAPKGVALSNATKLVQP